MLSTWCYKSVKIIYFSALTPKNIFIKSYHPIWIKDQNKLKLDSRWIGSLLNYYKVSGTKQNHAIQMRNLTKSKTVLKTKFFSIDTTFLIDNSNNNRENSWNTTDCWYLTIWQMSKFVVPHCKWWLRKISFNTIYNLSILYELSALQFSTANTRFLIL